MEDEQINDILSKALSVVLKETEGICVKYEGELYVVFKEDGEIFIGPGGDLIDAVSGKDIEDGMLVWLHKNETVV